MITKKHGPEARQQEIRNIRVSSAVGVEQGGRSYQEDHVEVLTFPSGETIISDLDGHSPGGNGFEATKQAAEVINTNLAHNLPRGVGIAEALKFSFDQAHESMVRSNPEAGACAVVCYMGKEGVTTANLGDTEARLFTNKGIAHLTKALSMEEAEPAIRSMGGAVIQGRVVSVDRRQRGPNVPESLGNPYFPMLREPHITYKNWERGLNVVVTGSDGLWPYITDGEIQAIIGQERGDVSRIQQRIIKTANQRAKNNAIGRARTAGSKPTWDNISCGVGVAIKN